MNKIGQSFIKFLFELMPEGIQDAIRVKRNKKELLKWEKEGKPMPPPHIVKQLMIIDFQKKCRIETLIETGTYMGAMVNAQKNIFKEIYSIELSKTLWARAKRKFKKFPHIFILQGDSSIILKDIVTTLNKKAIFWLDGHFSGGITALGEKECPILDELKAVLSTSFNHVVLIDDARCFNGTHDYPTYVELSDFVLFYKPNSLISIKNDVIIVEIQ